MAGKDRQKKLIDELLIGHNECRKIHGSPALTHNQELSKLALKWANTISARNRVEYSENKYKNSKLGEIIIKLPADDKKDIDGMEIARKWYDEIKNYKFEKPEINKNTEHFTQLIWKSTKEVGFGVAISPNGSYYLVANYYPAGNIPSRLKENVTQLS